MTKAVVDFLELVQIDHDYGKGSLAGGDFLIQVVYLPIVSGNVLHRRQFILIGLFLHGANVVSHPFHRIIHMSGQAADFIITGICQVIIIMDQAALRRRPMQQVPITENRKPWLKIKLNALGIGMEIDGLPIFE